MTNTTTTAGTNKIIWNNSTNKINKKADTVLLGTKQHYTVCDSYIPDVNTYWVDNTTVGSITINYQEYNELKEIKDMLPSGVTLDELKRLLKSNNCIEYLYELSKNNSDHLTPDDVEKLQDDLIELERENEELRKKLKELNG
jgi:hypothetical protein